MAALLVLSGAALSLHNTSSLSDAMGGVARLVVLFGLFGPLALAHSENIYKNALFIVGGIVANCGVALLQAWVYPGIVDMLSINPTQPDLSESGRLQALTSHPNILGFSAALAVLIALIMMSSAKGAYIRGRMSLIVLVCTVGALLSGSRTFIVALIAGLLVFGFSLATQRKVVFGVLISFIGVWSFLTYVTPAVLEQYSERLTLTGGDFAPDQGRYVAAGLALLEILQKPFLGWGPDHFGDAGLWLNPETGELAGVHNSFLIYWHGAGVLAATGFLVLFFVGARKIIQLLRKNLAAGSSDALRLALACYALLFVICNLHPILYNRFLYVPLFVFAGFTARSWNSLVERPADRKRSINQFAPGI